MIPIRSVCVAAAESGEMAVVYESHEQGSLLAVTRRGRLYACERCCLVYWKPLGKVERADGGRCFGITTQGKRCKLRAAVDSHYCGNHSHLEAQSRLIMADLVDDTGL